MPEQQPATETRKLLIVDDAENIRHLLKVTFRDEPYEILEAADGDNALQMARTEKPDIILLDLMLPGMSGMDVIAKLKSQPETRRIPVIMITAKSGSWDMLHGHLAGAEAYITKPFDPEEVRAKVRMFLKLCDEAGDED